MSPHLIRLEAAPDLADQVYRALLDAISTGALKPGQRITQEELAEQLAVSRQPVTQALKLLKKDGFVQNAPAAAGPAGRSRGLQVTPIDVHWIAQVYEVRGALDMLAVRLAASRRTPIDPALMAQGRHAVARGDIGAMIDADLAFHTALYRAAGNPLIEQSALLHWHHIRRAMGEALQSNLLREPVWDEHEAIAQAVSRGDVRQAERLMQAHCSHASAHLGQQMQEHAPDPSKATVPNLREHVRPATRLLRGSRLRA
ncbi:MAG: GntR family transcriptional regulator [Hydrogenophaga sp.]|jgi:DNA-binding GntR family transcriptional regulator|nr:GntR family transcriptional regulator [Hydrogenophaga sp.]